MLSLAIYLFLDSILDNEWNTCTCTHLQYSTVQYSTVQYSTVQYSTVQYSTETNALHIS